MPKHRCIISVADPDGLVEYYKFTGHKNTKQQLTNDPDDKFKLSEGDSKYCLEKGTAYDGKFRVNDDKIVSRTDWLIEPRHHKSQSAFYSNNNLSAHLHSFRFPVLYECGIGWDSGGN